MILLSLNVIHMLLLIAIHDHVVVSIELVYPSCLAVGAHESDALSWERPYIDYLAPSRKLRPVSSHDLAR
jgi:hypothetical protein